MRHLFLLAFFLGAGHAQAFHIHLHGVVTQYFSGETLSGVQVRLVKDGIERQTQMTRANGRYEFVLERGYNYLIWFHKPGWVTKHIRIDATGVPIQPDVPFFDMDLQMTLFEWTEGVDLSIFDQPLALAAYKHSVRNVSWNMEYTEALRPRIAAVMGQYEKVWRGYVTKRRRDDGGQPIPQ